MSKMYVARDKFEEIIKGQGATFTEQSGFLKVSGASGRHIYVAKSANVGRVDLSGFELPIDHPGVKPLKGESRGPVTQEIMFDDRAPDEILATFSEALALMLTLPARAKEKARQPGTPRPQKIKATTITTTPVAMVLAGSKVETQPTMNIPSDPNEMTVPQKRARLELIRKIAAERNMGVSSRALELYGDKETEVPTTVNERELVA